MQPDTRYTKSTGGVNIAYQVFGEGPNDLVIVPGWIFHIELVWEHPTFEALMRRLAKNFRVIMFDKRGTGLSDRIHGATPMEDRMDDVRAVMDAVGSDSAAVMGWSEGGTIALMYAATYPDRVTTLILYASGVRFVQAPDYPCGLTSEFLDMSRNLIGEHWGEGLGAAIAAPSRAQDPAFVKWFGRFERTTVSPGDALAMLEANMEIDATPLLEHVKTPTLILHNTNDALLPVGFSHYLAERLPDARFVELEGDDHLFWFSNTDAVVREIETSVLGRQMDDDPDRVLSTVLFTDIVGATARASSIGDSRWRELLDQHDRVVRERLPHFRGTLVKATGDGILATFDGPARAIRCALRLRRDMADLGLEMRAGVHTGEVELRGADVGGIAVHIGARIAAEADHGEVLASRTVRDLVAGSGISFEDRGVRELKGLHEAWHLYAASN